MEEWTLVTCINEHAEALYLLGTVRFERAISTELPCAKDFLLPILTCIKRWVEVGVLIKTASRTESLARRL